MLQGPDPAIRWWGRRWGGRPRLSRVRWRIWCLAGQPASEGIPCRPASWCPVSLPLPSYLFCLGLYVHLSTYMCLSDYSHTPNAYKCVGLRLKCMRKISELYVSWVVSITSGRNSVPINQVWHRMKKAPSFNCAPEFRWYHIQVSLSPLFGMTDETTIKLDCSSAFYRYIFFFLFFLSDTQCDQINSCQNFCWDEHHLKYVWSAAPSFYLMSWFEESYLC